MFSSSLRVSFVALVASAVAVSAAPAGLADGLVGLVLTIVTSLLGFKGDGSENMNVITTVSNNGDKPLKLLKDPRGVLSSFPENSFSITGHTGSQPSFNGARVKYSPKYAAGLDDKSAYIVLNPGEKVDVTHDLAKAYEFTNSGTGKYTIEPSNLFTIIGEDGSLKDVHATIGNTAEVKLSGDLPAPRVHDKRANFNGCSFLQQWQVKAAISSAQSYAKNTFSYISGVSSATTRYTTWFGEYDEDRKSIVQKHFELINGNNFAGFTYDCTCTDAGVYAYVYPDNFGTIYLCGAFFKSPLVGTDSMTGTLIHEASHFDKNGGTRDYAYGQADCKDLAESEPETAIVNADSHEYFAENSPSLS